jgi:hypothetical protein
MGLSNQDKTVIPDYMYYFLDSWLPQWTVTTAQLLLSRRSISTNSNTMKAYHQLPLDSLCDSRELNSPLVDSVDSGADSHQCFSDGGSSGIIDSRSDGSFDIQCATSANTSQRITT